MATAVASKTGTSKALVDFDVHDLVGIAAKDDVADGIGIGLVPAVGHALGDDRNIPGLDILKDPATNLSSIHGAQ